MTRERHVRFREGGGVRFLSATRPIVGFAHEHEARAFLDDLKERMRKFELALHPDKTRLIRFGRHAAKQRAERGEGKPETFDFLGFTHFCTRSRNWGSFVIGRKTIKKRMRAKLLAIKIELRKIMHDPIAKTGAWVKQMLKGHLNYFAVSGNHPSLWPYLLPGRLSDTAAIETSLTDVFLGPDERFGSVVVCVDVGIDVILQLLEACEGGAAERPRPLGNFR